MSKKNKIKRSNKAIWISEETMIQDLGLIEKMVPSETKDSVSSLIKKGFLIARVNPATGKREVRMNPLYGKSEAE